MIEKIQIKDYLGFQDVNLDFHEGLIAFTGASGAGKSILMKAILTLFGYEDCDARLIEGIYNKKLNLEEFNIQNDEPNIITFIKEKSARYFINTRFISKKNHIKVFNKDCLYLSAKLNDELDNKKLLLLLDELIMKKDESFHKLLQTYEQNFNNFNNLKNELNKIIDQENKIEQLKELANFEVQKILSISPKPGEYEELMSTKKFLSQKEKILNSIENLSPIFDFNSSVYEFLNLQNHDNSFFDECMNELNLLVENAKEKLEFSDELDIEKILDRIEEISSLVKRYGSIEEALKVCDAKQKELKYYENITYEKESLNNKIKLLNKDLEQQAQNISDIRQTHIKEFEDIIQKYLKKLFLNKLDCKLKTQSLQQNGKDILEILLENTNIKNLSSGELNRLRLALLATNANIKNFASGVLLLDEIDANLSGKESTSIAEVLKELSKFYQIFVISHQPQLSSSADEHFLVEKTNNISNVKLLKDDEKVFELARMISGKEITKEAIEFAKSLIKNKNAKN